MFDAMYHVGYPYHLVMCTCSLAYGWGHGLQLHLDHIKRLPNHNGAQTTHSSCQEVGKGSVTVIISCIHQILWTIITLCTEDELLLHNPLTTATIYSHTITQK